MQARTSIAHQVLILLALRELTRRLLKAKVLKYSPQMCDLITNESQTPTERLNWDLIHTTRKPEGYASTNSIALRILGFSIQIKEKLIARRYKFTSAIRICHSYSKHTY